MLAALLWILWCRHCQGVQGWSWNGAVLCCHRSCPRRPSPLLAWGSRPQRIYSGKLSSSTHAACAELSLREQSSIPSWLLDFGTLMITLIHTPNFCFLCFGEWEPLLSKKFLNRSLQEDINNVWVLFICLFVCFSAFFFQLDMLLLGTGIWHSSLRYHLRHLHLCWGAWLKSLLMCIWHSSLRYHSRHLHIC